MLKLTCLLLLAGVISLANANGQSTTKTHKKPSGTGALTPATNQAVVANSNFAVDLYREMAKENPGRNLFFSPYSMSGALTMTAEGARGETARQMGKVLGFPDAVRHNGDDAKKMPWDMAPIHAGMLELSRSITPKPLPKQTSDQIAALRAELAAANAKAEELRPSGKWDEYNTQAMKSQELADRLNALLLQTDHYELCVANALYGEKTYPFRQAYLDSVNQYYGTGSVVPMDFKHHPEAARVKINAWVEGKTEQRIRDLIPRESVNSVTSLVLCNAIYFKGKWAQPFQEGATRQEDFLAAGGRKVSASMMHHDHMGGVRYGAFNGDGSFFSTPETIKREGETNALYPNKGGFLAAELPYKGNELSMLIFLPQDANGLGGLEKQLSRINLQRWVGKLEQRTVNVHLPKFKLETDYQEMAGTLRKLGMIRAFNNPSDSKAGAQFEGMCASDDPRLQLSISKVCHKAFVEVSEKGTEAAAATAVMINAAGCCINREEDVPFTPTFQVDKPFLFAIRDVKTGTILFLGRVVNPNT
jgi:serine protease inhibitor